MLRNAVRKIINFGQFCNKKYQFCLPYFNINVCANPACMCLTNLMWTYFPSSFDQIKPDSSHSFDSAADLSISHPKLWQNKFQFFGSWICWGQDLVRLALLSPKETIQQCAGQNFLLYKYKYKYRRKYKYRYLFGSVSTVSQGDHSTMWLARLVHSTR